jgi:hypothetical protein
MATENQRMVTTIEAAEDLTAARYHAIAVNDGKLAVNGTEASGILLNKPKSGEFAAVGYVGEMTYAAGAAVTKGDALTVATSGWFTKASSYSTVIGEAKTTVTSGSFGTGFFTFPQANTAAEGVYVTMTTATSIQTVAGVCVNLVTKTIAATGEATQAIGQTVVASNTSGQFLAFGKGIGLMSKAYCASLGDLLRATTSGDLMPCEVGSYGNVTALANIGSGTTGAIMFWGAQHGARLS